MTKVAILASHNGSGFDALYNASDFLNIHIGVVISNNSSAKVLQKAIDKKIPNFIVNNKLYENSDNEIYNILKEHSCNIVFLSGYMKKLSPLLTNNFKIINSHPSLLPKYGGPGMYGKFVHEEVIKNSEVISGVTIHEVNKNYDEGKIILQKSITLSSDETVDSLETKIKQLEQKTIVEAFKMELYQSNPL